MKPLGPSEPRQIGRYRIVAALGEGGMGRVLLGASPDGRLVAVKQVHPGFAHDQGFRSRFRREVDTSRMVSGAYTAAVMDADPDAETPWLASVFVAGPSLREAVDAAGPLPVPAIRLLAIGLASALTEIHRAGLVHRDLKPSNVLLTDDGPRVIDFGIARAVEDSAELTHTGSIIGSPGFMSPEQAAGGAISSASDVFSLGALLVMAATGHSPFLGSTTPQTLYNLVHAEPELTAVPPDIRRLAEPCLAKDPAARPTPEQILDFLGPVQPGVSPWPPAVHQQIHQQRGNVQLALNAPPPPFPPPGSTATMPGGGHTLAGGAAAPSRKRRTGLVVGALVTAIALVGGTVLTVNLLRDDPPAPPVAGGEPAKNPVNPAAMRGIAACELLDGATLPDLGTLTVGSEVPFRECSFENGTEDSIDIDLGARMNVEGSDSPPTQVAGLSVVTEKNENDRCSAIAPFPDESAIGVEITVRLRETVGPNPCDTAVSALQTALNQINSGVGKQPPDPASLAGVDPCTVVEKSALEGHLGVISDVTPENLNSCEWTSRGRLSIDFERNGYAPDEDTGTPTVPVELGNGVTAYQEEDPEAREGGPCRLSWAHRQDGEYWETVSLSFSNSGDDATHTANCDTAQAVARSYAEGLSRP